MNLVKNYRTGCYSEKWCESERKRTIHLKNGEMEKIFENLLRFLEALTGTKGALDPRRLGSECV